ncbi:hypothetical protein ABBQ38_008864 [Trebouxia sp. C0009 RCD-2024]
MADVTMKTESASNPGQTAAAAGASGAPQNPQSSPLEAGKAEKIALNTHAALNTAAMPVRQYLEATVVPVLMSGLGQVVRERPSDPVEYLAAYLLKHNPQQQQQPQSAVPAPKPT